MLSLLFKVGADATGAERAMAAAAKKGEAAFKSMGKEITGRLGGMFAASAILDRIVGFTEAVIDNADALDEMSDIMGMSIEDIQKLQVAANLAGVPLKRLKGVLDGITALQQQAQTGDKKALGIFSGLGLDPNKATALEVMMQAVGATKGTASATAAADLFGKRFNDVAATMRAMKSMGPIELITTEQAKALAQAKDDMEAALRKLKVAATPSVAAGASAAGNMFNALNIMMRDKVPLPVAMIKEMMGRTTEGGVDLSALPLPKDKQAILDAMNKSKTDQGATAATPPAAIALGLQSDALSRIGLFVGGRGDVGNQLVSIGNYQLSELRAIRAGIEHANR